jgi:coproporphyrinogen III oxidase
LSSRRGAELDAVSGSNFRVKRLSIQSHLSRPYVPRIHCPYIVRVVAVELEGEGYLDCLSEGRSFAAVVPVIIVLKDLVHFNNEAGSSLAISIRNEGEKGKGIISTI